MLIARPARPLDLQVKRTGQLPPGGIGHSQGQAAIGLPVHERIHPLAPGPRRNEIGGNAVDHIGVKISLHCLCHVAYFDKSMRLWKDRNARHP